MFSTAPGYVRLSTTRGTIGHSGDEDIDIPSAGEHWTQRPARINRRLVRCVIIFLLTSITLGLVHLHTVFRPPGKPKGEFDECPILLGPQPGQEAEKLPYQRDEDEASWSKLVLPGELFAMLERGEAPPSQIIHQTWKNRDALPQHFQKWSSDWRRLHGRNWIYVLWTDEDNRQLAQRYYPDFLKTYDALPREIFRADMVRNMYMHSFGGVYADLDLVPLSPLHNHLPDLVLPDDERPRAYVGQMGDKKFDHSIPNAFMAASLPGHPFWIRPLEFVRNHLNDTRDENAPALTPEELTGPVALRDCTLTWLAEEKAGHSKAQANKVQVIEDGKIYPLSWAGAAPLNWCLCRLHSPWFSQSRCNELYPRAWTITYWTHSW